MTDNVVWNVFSLLAAGSRANCDVLVLQPHPDWLCCCCYFCCGAVSRAEASELPQPGILGAATSSVCDTVHQHLLCM